MASPRSATVLALLLISLSLTVLAAVAVRVPHRVHAAYGNHHAGLHSLGAGSAKLKLKIRGADSEFELLHLDVGIKFQMAIVMDGETQYLYSEGEKVKTTADPDSVGVRRTIWMVVEGVTPGSMDYSGAMSIQNVDTGARLYYDEESGRMYGAWIEGNGSPISGWRMWQSSSDMETFKLENVPAGRVFVDFPGNDEPKRFMIRFMPMEEEEDRRSASAAGVAKLVEKEDSDEFQLLRLSMGTQFQIRVTMDGEKKFLYAEGSEVMATSDPDSVGVRRTIWMVVPGIAPLIMPYVNAVAIQNRDTRARLYYDAEKEMFYLDWVLGNGSPISGWRMWQSNSNSGHFKMQNVPAGSVFVDYPGNDKPRVFDIMFMPPREREELEAAAGKRGARWFQRD